MAETPHALGYRMPAEWEPHEGTWLSWPHNPRTWVGNFGPIPHVFAEIVRGACAYENVHISVRNVASEQSVRGLLQAAGVDCSAVQYHLIPTNDAWARDHGPIFVTKTPYPSPAQPMTPMREHLAIVHWNFNAWGGKYPPWDDDDAVPERITEHYQLPCFRPGMVLEGGSIDVNGCGTVLTTEAVLLNPNRNPDMSKAEIEQKLVEYLNTPQVIWLGDGVVGDDTDGHIDDLTRFVAPDTIVSMVEEDPSDINYRALNENWERLQNLRDPLGRSFKLVKLPTPGPIYRGAQHGERPPEERLPASYANFYITNGSVLVPVFNQPNDEKALGIIGELFPGRKVIGIQCRDLVGGYGAIHCVTQQQPV